MRGDFPGDCGATPGRAVAQHLRFPVAGRGPLRGRVRGVPPALLLLGAAWTGLGGAACAAKHGPSDVMVTDAGGYDAVGDALLAVGGPCTGNTICDPVAARVVRSCDPPTEGEVVETCAEGQVCRLGRCVTPACAGVSMAPSIAGCLFYTAALDNVDSDDGKPSLIAVSNPGDAPANVHLDERTADEAWVTAQALTIAGTSAGSFTVTSTPVQGGGLGPGLARRIVSDVPVTVMVVQSDDADHDATSSAGTMLLPDHALGHRYMAMTYQQSATPRMADMPGARGGAAEIAIIATADRTTLQILPPGVPTDAAPTIIWMKDEGDVYQLVSENEDDDLGGTLIQADKPVAVFSGNVVTAYGQSAAGINSPDMAMEQMLPTTEWSRTYVAARLPPQTSVCDSLFMAGPGGGAYGPVSFWRIVSERQAMLTFVAPPTVQGLPIGPTPISPGVPYTYTVTGTGDFIVHSTQPIIMTQGMDCEPTLSSAVPVDQPLGPQLLALAPGFEHALAIVRRDEHGVVPPVILDDSNISALFTPVAEGFSVARVVIPPCAGPIDRCVHRLLGAYGVTLRGMDVACSYAVTPATWTMCTDGPC